MTKETNRKELSLAEAESARKKWGVPNWRDASAYEYTEHYSIPSLVDDQLRWEFLRRNQEYRRLWRDGYSFRSLFGLIKPLDPALNSKQLGGCSVLFVDSVFRGHPVNMAAPVDSNEDSFIKKYGEFLLGAEQDGFLILGFNPILPMRQQIEHAEAALNHYRAKLKEANETLIERESKIEKPSWLLRSLDAHNEKASLLTIGRSIYQYTGNDPDQKAKARSIAHERLNAAHGYWQRIAPLKHKALL